MVEMVPRDRPVLDDRHELSALPHLGPSAGRLGTPPPGHFLGLVGVSGDGGIAGGTAQWGLALASGREHRRWYRGTGLHGMSAMNYLNYFTWVQMPGGREPPPGQPRGTDGRTFFVFVFFVFLTIKLHGRVCSMGL